MEQLTCIKVVMGCAKEKSIIIEVYPQSCRLEASSIVYSQIKQIQLMFFNKDYKHKGTSYLTGGRGIR